MVLESILWIPIFLLLIVGMVQFGKMTFVYYQLKKALYTAGTYVATQQGVDFCNLTGDTTIVGGLNLALTGTTDRSRVSQFPSLTTDLIQVTTECVDSSGAVGTCSINGCDGAAGAQRPDYLVVSIPDGYQFPLRIPYILLDPVLLRPQVRVPFGGT